MQKSVSRNTVVEVSRWVFVLIAVSVVLGLFGCSGDTVERQAEHFSRAQEFYDQELFDKARIETQNVLQLNDKHVPARYLMGLISEKNKNWEQAYASYSLVVEEQPENLDAQIKLGQIFLLSGEQEKAKEKLDLVLGKDPEHIDAQLLNAVFYLRDKDIEKSQAVVNNVLTKLPNHIEATSLLAQILVGEGKTDLALTKVDAAIVVHPEDKSLRFLKIALHRKLNQLTEAEAEFKKLVELDPDNDKLKYALAEYLVSIDKHDNAEKLLQEMIESKPDDITAKLARIKFLAQFKGRQRADEALEAYVNEYPGEYKLRFALGELRHNQPDQAKLVYEKIVELDDTGNDGLEARVRLAQIAMQLTDKQKAKQLVDEVLDKDDENKQALLIRSSLFLEEKKVEEAISDLRTILGNDPQFEPALRLLSVAHLVNDDRVLARETLEKAVKSDPRSTKSRTMLAGLMYRNNDIDAAGDLLEDGLKLNPNDNDSLQMLTDIYIKQKRWDSATKSARALLANSKEQPYKAHFVLGSIFQKQGKLDKALEEFKIVLAEKPDNVNAIRRLVETTIAQKKPDQALKFLSDRTNSNPEDANSHELIGEIHTWQKQPKKAEKAYLTAIKTNPKLVVAYRQLARLYMQEKQSDKVVSTYQQGLAAVPEQPELLMELAAQYQNLGEIEKAILMYKKIVDANPKSLYAVNNYAALIADARDDKASLENAMKLVDEFKSTDQPAFLDTFGWLAYRLNQYNEALPALEKAVDLAPGFPVFRYHLGMAYHAVDRDKAALRELSEAVKTEGTDFAGIKDARLLIDQLKKDNSSL